MLGSHERRGTTKGTPDACFSLFLSVSLEFTRTVTCDRNEDAKDTAEELSTEIGCRSGLVSSAVRR